MGSDTHEWDRDAQLDYWRTRAERAEAATAEAIATWLLDVSNESTTLSYMTLRDYGLQDYEGRVRRAATMFAKDIRARWVNKETP